jgi:hypothetical protein
LIVDKCLRGDELLDNDSCNWAFDGAPIEHRLGTVKAEFSNHPVLFFAFADEQG